MEVMIASYFFVNAFLDSLGCVWILQELGLQLEFFVQIHRESGLDES